MDGYLGWLALWTWHEFAAASLRFVGFDGSSLSTNLVSYVFEYECQPGAVAQRSHLGGVLSSSSTVAMENGPVSRRQMDCIMVSELCAVRTENIVKGIPLAAVLSETIRVLDLSTYNM